MNKIICRVNLSYFCLDAKGFYDYDKNEKYNSHKNKYIKNIIFTLLIFTPCSYYLDLGGYMSYKLDFNYTIQ